MSADRRHGCGRSHLPHLERVVLPARRGMMLARSDDLRICAIRASVLEAVAVKCARSRPAWYSILTRYPAVHHDAVLHIKRPIAAVAPRLRGASPRFLYTPTIPLGQTSQSLLLRPTVQGVCHRHRRLRCSLPPLGARHRPTASPAPLSPVACRRLPRLGQPQPPGYPRPSDACHQTLVHGEVIPRHACGAEVLLKPLPAAPPASAYDAPAGRGTTGLDASRLGTGPRGGLPSPRAPAAPVLR